ncbi:Hypothetical predicted protein [Paramuricea clavata]|uniref:Uncharacterized protein n=1 Tax=Paramuricea clavata TaxID=317549 RepID=A0A6S7HGC2_PARCT|nr:Hypothetical predicted protein [Paramuricea clavata]
MSINGRIGLLTNYRQSEKFMKHGAKRRGKLVTDFLKSGDAPHKYLEKVKETGKDYKGFNLIVGNVSPGDSTAMEFGYYCNQENEPFDNLKPGVHALSNRYLDYEWKKVSFGKERFQEIIKRKSSVKEKVNSLIEMLQDETKYPDDELFLGPQDDGISQSFLESFTAISVLITEHPSCGTRYVKLHNCFSESASDL